MQEISHKLPKEFIERVEQDLPGLAPGLLVALSDTPTVAVRFHPVKGNSVGDELRTGQKVPWCNDAYYVENRPVFTLDPLHHAGAYYVQEPSSMFLFHVLEALSLSKEGIRILDLCASPGGKSTLMASWLGGEGILVCNEVIQSRTAIVAENMIRWGYANTLVTQNDAADFGRLDEFFDIVLIDAPCSGEGLFRKDPDAMLQWSTENCDLSASRQRRILSDVLPALKQDGILIYSTCTFNPAENDENISWLRNQFNMEVVEINIGDDWGITRTLAGGYAFYPNLIRGEGFYICCLKKTEPSEAINITPRRHHRKQLADVKIDDDILDQVKGYLNHPDEYFFHQVLDDIYCFPLAMKNEFFQVRDNLKLRYDGVNLAAIKGKKIIPAHALALSTEFNHTNIPKLELELNDALKYLKRDTPPALARSAPGWNIVIYKGRTLGWIKNIGNRVNNYYPIELRIRMSIPE